MALSSVSNQTQDERVRSLLWARKKYSDYSKELSKSGIKERAALKLKIEEDQKEIIRVKEELEKYRREYNRVIETMGRAHEDAVFRENQDDMVNDLIKQRNKRVKSRAELVLLEEIHRAKLMDLKKQLEKEKTLKRRRDIYRMKSPSSKVRVNNKENQEKLSEWKQFEELVQQELKQLLEEKEQARLRKVYLETKKIECQSNEIKPVKVIPKIFLSKPKPKPKPKQIANAQVQTSFCVDKPKQITREAEFSSEESFVEVSQKKSSPSQVDLQFVPPSVLRPTKQSNSTLENLISVKVAEKMARMRSKADTFVKLTTKITKDAAINTSHLAEDDERSISDFSQTCYIGLPSGEKNTASKVKPVETQKVENSIKMDNKEPSMDLSIMSNINLEELVEKIQRIKHLVNKAEPRVEMKPITLIKRPVIDPIEAVVTSSNQRVCHKETNNSKDLICEEDQISPVSSISPSLSPPRSLSPTDFVTTLSTSPLRTPSPLLPTPTKFPGLSDSTPCLSSASSTASDATIRKRDSCLSLDDISFSSLSNDDDQSMEQGRFGDDTSSIARPRSLQASIDFSQFSKLLNVDKDKLWADVLDLAGVNNKSTTFTTTPLKKYPNRFTQSTPKTIRTTKQSVVFDCSTNQVTIPN